MECRSDALLVLFENAKFAGTAQTFGKFSERWTRWRSTLRCCSRRLCVVFAWRRLPLAIGKLSQVITELKIFNIDYRGKINSNFQFSCRNAKISIFCDWGWVGSESELRMNFGCMKFPVGSGRAEPKNFLRTCVVFKKIFLIKCYICIRVQCSFCSEVRSIKLRCL